MNANACEKNLPVVIGIRFCMDQDGAVGKFHQESSQLIKLCFCSLFACWRWRKIIVKINTHTRIISEKYQTLARAIDGLPKAKKKKNKSQTILTKLKLKKEWSVIEKFINHLLSNCHNSFQVTVRVPDPIHISLLIMLR